MTVTFLVLAMKLVNPGQLTLCCIITPFDDYLKILWKMVSFLLFGANAPFSIIFSKVFKTLL